MKNETFSALKVSSIENGYSIWLCTIIKTQNSKYTKLKKPDYIKYDRKKANALKS